VRVRRCLAEERAVPSARTISSLAFAFASAARSSVTSFTSKFPARAAGAIMRSARAAAAGERIANKFTICAWSDASPSSATGAGRIAYGMTQAFDVSIALRRVRVIIALELSRYANCTHLGMRRSSILRALGMSILSLVVAPTSILGCGRAGGDAQAGDAAEVNEGTQQLEQELRLLGGSDGDLASLGALLDQHLAVLNQQKADAKAQAAREVVGYTQQQWDRSWFRKTDELDTAVDARSRDIFDRPERRDIDATKAKKIFVDDLRALIRQGRAGTPEAPTFEGWYLRNGYYEVAISLFLNSRLGLDKQAGKILTSALQKRFSFLAQKSDVEANNIDRSGDPQQFWRLDPFFSTAWHRRRPDEVTPTALYRGPWFHGKKGPHMPQANEVWKLAALRSQAADGAHASADIELNGTTMKMKLARDTDKSFFVEPAYARLLWAIGYETDPQYLLKDVRVEPRVFLAAHAAQERIGLTASHTPGDEMIPGRPPVGIAIAGIDEAPGARWLSVRFKDGREEVGDAALHDLKEAMNQRPLMDSMESVVIRRAYAEIDLPEKRAGIGPWDYDAVNHIEQRETRAIGIIMMGWLGSNDLKFNNVRFDIDTSSGTRPLPYFHTLSDVGGTVTDFGFEVGVRFDQKHLHPGTNREQIDAFDKATMSDVRWGIAQIAKLTEEQIVACVATSAFDDVALGIMSEKLIARRDDLVRAFGLDHEIPLLRPNGPNRNPPPRHFDPL
jgi:hypothetical protein